MANEDIPKRIDIIPANVLMGKDIVPHSDVKGAIPITDTKIRQILARFAPILHQGIAEANTFFSRASSKTIHSSFVMEAEEVEMWDQEYAIRERTMDAVRSGKLFVPDISFDDLELLQKDGPINPLNGQGLSGANQIDAAKEGRFRVNLDPAVYVPIKHVDPTDMKFLIRPYAHLGGYLASMTGGLYNAFIAMSLYVKDRDSKWIVDHIAGTGNVPWNKPVYGPFGPIGMSLWFNTSVHPEKANDLKVKVHGAKEIMLSAEIHHPEQLDQLEIPQDRGIQFFFWQLDKFIGNALLDNPRRMLPLPKQNA